MKLHRLARAVALAAAAGLAFAALAPGATGQGSVVKCIDADGNVTYQDSPCTAGQAGRSVTLPKAETREDTTAWDAAARDGRVVKGMPKRWVLRARGTPAEIRPGAGREDATEIWRYATAQGALLVGFAGPGVAWVREDTAARGGPPPAGRPSGPAPTAEAPPAAGPAAGPTIGAQNRRFVIAGRFCDHVFAEIGAADRAEKLGTDPGAGVRYFYDPQAADGQMRTAFTCVDGKVVDVERVLVQ